MVIKDADYYLAQYVSKAITLVDQDYITSNGPETRAEVWNLYKWLVVHPQNEPLPEVHKKVKGFAWCCACKKVVKYSGSASTLADHVNSKSLKTYPKESSRSQDFLYLVRDEVWMPRGWIAYCSAAAQLARAKSHVSHWWLMIDSVYFFCECPQYFLLQWQNLKIFSCPLTPRCFAP